MYLEVGGGVDKRYGGRGLEGRGDVRAEESQCAGCGEQIAGKMWRRLSGLWPNRTREMKPIAFPVNLSSCSYGQMIYGEVNMVF